MLTAHDGQIYCRAVPVARIDPAQAARALRSFNRARVLADAVALGALTERTTALALARSVGLIGGR